MSAAITWWANGAEAPACEGSCGVMVESHGNRGRSSKAELEQGSTFGTGVHRVRPASRRDRRILHHLKRHFTAFGRAVCAVWPVKPALRLAQLIGCSERAARYQMNGERGVSARAMHALDQACLDDQEG